MFLGQRSIVLGWGFCALYFSTAVAQESLVSFGNEGQDIVGGDDVTNVTDPVYLHTVRLLMTGTLPTTGIPDHLKGTKFSWRCSGTIVHKRVILSAGHCFPKVVTFMDSITSQVVTATLAALKGEVYYKVTPKVDNPMGALIKSFVTHPGWNDKWINSIDDAWNPTTPINDIALAYLVKDVPSDKRVVPLATLNTAPLADGAELVLAGYGKTLSENPFEAPQLRKVSVPFRALLRNRNDYFVGAGDYLNPKRVTTPHGACAGDSGGPAYRVINDVWSVAGVIVRGPDDANGACEASVTIATDVRAYASWIKTTISSMTGDK